MTIIRWTLLVVLLGAFFYLDWAWVDGSAAYPLAPLAVGIVVVLAWILAAGDLNHGIEDDEQADSRTA